MQDPLSDSAQEVASAPAQRDTIADIRVWNDRLIELLWLLPLVLVPLVFAPPGWFAYFEVPKVAISRAAAAGIVLLWSFDLALTVWYRGVPSINHPLHRLRGWLREGPLRWGVVFAAAYLAWATISTAVSAVPSVALWGYEYGRDGQSLLAIASMVVIFMAIAVRLHRPAQVWRMAGATIASGFFVSFYAALQALEIDPYDLSRILPGRVIGTLLNPIFLASMLLQVVPVALTVALILARRKAHLPWAVAIAGVAGFALVMIVLTSARGPWVGTATALIFWVGLVASTGDKRLLKTGGAVLAALVVVGAAGLIFLRPAEGESSVGSTFDRLGSFSGTLTGDVSGRRDIWEASIGLIQNRPWFEEDDGASPVLRHLFGYGPDLFLYVYPLKALLTHSEKIRLVKDAHNLWANAAVETGVIGAIFLLLSAAIPGFGGGYFILFRWRGWPLAYRLMAIALVASIAGHAVEQLVGVSQVSDAIVPWALVGLLIALPRVVEGQAPEPLDTSEPSPLALRAITATLAVVVIFAAAIAGWTHTTAVVFAARDAADSLVATRENNDPLRAMELMESAIALAPESSAYRVRQAQLLEAFRLRAGTAVDDEVLIQGSLSVVVDGLAYNPLPSP